MLINYQAAELQIVVTLHDEQLLIADELLIQSFKL